MQYQIKLSIEAVMDSGAPLGVSMSVKTFDLTISPEAAELTFTPKCFGLKCCMKPFTLALGKVTKAKLISCPYTTPALMLQVEEELCTTLIYKVWVLGPEGSMAACFQDIEATRRLMIAPVVVAGSFDMLTRPSSSSLSYYSREETAKIFEAKTKLDGVAFVEKAVAESLSDRVTLNDAAGVIVLTRFQYGVEMVHEVDGSPVASVVCGSLEPCRRPQLQLHYAAEQKPDGLFTYKVATHLQGRGATQGVLTNLIVEVPSAAILTSPYQSEIKAGKFEPAKTGNVKAWLSMSARTVKRTVSVSRSPSPPPRA